MVENTNEQFRKSRVKFIMADKTSDPKPKKKKKKQLSDTQKSRALAFLEEGVTQNEVSKRMNTSERTIGRLAKTGKQLKPGEVPKRKKGSGRKKKIDMEGLNQLKKSIKRNPKLTAKSLKKMHPKTLGKISLRTIRRTLQVDLNLPSFKAAKKPFISKRIKRQRIEFAEQFGKWSPSKWEKVFFQDEAMFMTARREGTELEKINYDNLYKNACLW